MPRVFISYCHESDQVKQDMRDLVVALRRVGVDARLDQFELPHPADGWPAWSARQIVEADYVLALCTPSCHDRFTGLVDKDVGLGVRWEARVIQNQQYQKQQIDHNSNEWIYRRFFTQFVPLLPTGLPNARFYIPAAVVAPDFVPLQKDLAANVRRLLTLLQCQPGAALPEPPQVKFDAQPSTEPIPEDASVLTDETWQQTQAEFQKIDQRLSNIQSILEGVDTQLQRQAAPPLIMPPPRPRPEPENVTSLILDLQYERQRLPFRKPLDAWRQLSEFVNNDAPFQWWAVLADGGVGKTRLAYELMLRLSRREGWEVGFLDNKDKDWLTESSNSWRPLTDTLIAIDYAAGRSSSIPDGLKNLAANPYTNGEKTEHKVRVLLLDRMAKNSGWSSTLAMANRQSDHYGRIVNEQAREHLFQPRVTTAVANLDGNAPEEPNQKQSLAAESLDSKSLFTQEEALLLARPAEADWAEWIAAAAQQVDGQSSITAVKLSEQADWRSRVQRLSDGGRPLYLQLLGICFASQPDLLDRFSDSGETEDLLDWILDFEIEHRWPLAFGSGPQDKQALIESTTFEALKRGVAFVTLTRSVTLPQHMDVLFRITGGNRLAIKAMQLLLPQKALADDIFQVDGYQPDLLGERLLVRMAGQTDQKSACRKNISAHSIDIHGWLAAAANVNPKGMVEMLKLVSQDFPISSLNWTKPLLDVCKTRQFPDLVASLPKLLLNPSIVSVRNQIDYDEQILTPLVEQAKLSEVDWLYFFEAADRTLRIAAETSWEAFRQQVSTILTAKFSIPESVVYFCGRAIFEYGSTGDWTAAESWGDTLRKHANKFRRDEELQYQGVRGASKAIVVYQRANNSAGVQRWGKTLRECGTRNRDHVPSQLSLAKSAFRLIRFFGRTKDWTSLEHWGEVLSKCANRHQTHPRIQLELVRGIGSGFQACAISEEDCKNSSCWEAFEDLLPFLIDAIDRSSITASLYQASVSRLASVQQSVPKRVMESLLSYWPGCLFDTDRGEAFPSACLDHQIESLDHIFCEELQRRCNAWHNLNSELLPHLKSWLNAAKLSPENDNLADAERIVSLVRQLWNDRMFSPDRGDSLVPLLKKFELTDQLLEAANEPWRRCTDSSSD